jgi:hypothetical protein
MKKMCSFISIALLTLSFSAFSQEIYQWVDEKGTIHFADDLTLVPEKYRDRVHKKKPPQEPSPSPSPRPQEMERRPSSEPSSDRKDLLGRDEQWWREKVKEWEDKFQNAQKNYEKAYQAWRAKEKELEDSTLKPHSVRRRMKAEIKELEEKTKAAEKEVEEAKRMLEKVLPGQAEEDRADPKWLKPKEQVENTPGTASSPEPVPAGAAPPPEPMPNK